MNHVLPLCRLNSRCFAGAACSRSSASTSTSASRSYAPARALRPLPSDRWHDSVPVARLLAARAETSLLCRIGCSAAWRCLAKKRSARRKAKHGTASGRPTHSMSSRRVMLGAVNRRSQHRPRRGTWGRSSGYPAVSTSRQRADMASQLECELDTPKRRSRSPCGSEPP